jgi:hypothetical protein
VCGVPIKFGGKGGGVAVVDCIGPGQHRRHANADEAERQRIDGRVILAGMAGRQEQQPRLPGG